MSELDNFLDELHVNGLEGFRKFYGVYRATVTDNKDPQTRGRILAAAQSIGQQKDLGVWLDPMMPYAGKSHGSFWPPEIGDSVYVVFHTGDASQPFAYLPGWFGTGDLPNQLGYGSGGKPTKRGFVTAANHSLAFNDDTGSNTIELKWQGGAAFLTFDNSGNIAIQNQTGSKVTLSGNTITIQNAVGAKAVVDQAQITLTDAAQNMVQLDGVSSIKMQNNTGNSMMIGPAGITMQSTGPTLIQSVGPITLQSPSVLLGAAPNSGVTKWVELAPYLINHQHLTAVGPSSGPLPQYVAMVPGMLSPTVLTT